MGTPSAPESEKWGTPRAGVSIHVPQALLLLLLLGVGGQGSTPGSRCDCAGDVQRRYGPSCCRGCPMGHYLKVHCTEHCGDSTCLPCPRGTFLARENHYSGHCTRCQTCDEEASQVALENCSAVADTRCGCAPGQLIDCSVKPCMASSPFRCLSCLDCKPPENHTPTPCFGRDNSCGPCLPGFYEHSNGCVSCPTSFLGSCPEPCAVVCGWRPTPLSVFWVQVLVPGLAAPFLLGALLICLYWRCQPHKLVVPDKAGTEALSPPQASHLSPPDSNRALLSPPGNSGKVCTIQLVGNSWPPGPLQTQKGPHQQVPQSWDQLPSHTLAPPAGSPASMLQPGPQLYDVMDAVPARRWKEFVRTLGLREAEIEAVEVEIGRFRDQQYEMLKRWRQQQPAGLGAVYAALERMGLDGCAEDLRHRLQRGP
ncbi:tumor necrosis factor receptor superfamily member 25 isoform X2 [Fukomys damarensis]|uniref:tumor necrosis factor receptor superfamily member 25 isoform X2 n=1 Tax=Fukomys damarensis TaxID=885580 RepID=UPI00053FA619|nr:tumor necrosis factor receptor superfamily member 25 isoform X2 [Fukomys damarensis]